MKKIFNGIVGAVALLVLVLSAGCSTAPVPMSGDIVFVVEQANADGADDMEKAIMDATGSQSRNATHVGIIEVSGDSLWVIDATPRHGVSRRPFSDFQEEAKGAELVIMRLCKPLDADAVISRAKALVGSGYDFTFLPDNDSYYCSELVQACFIDVDGNPVFSSQPMNFKDSNGEFPGYWTELFEGLEMPVPQDVPGTNPQDMMLSDLLRML